jgi:hypothetical protein
MPSNNKDFVITFYARSWEKQIPYNCLSREGENMLLPPTKVRCPFPSLFSSSLYTGRVFARQYPFGKVQLNRYESA